MRTAEEAINAIYAGHLIECSKEDYENVIRPAVQAQAGKWIDQNQDLRAMIALEEIKRLDIKFT